MYLNIKLLLPEIIEVLFYLVCILFTIAYLTIAERKSLAYIQRRLGPNIVG
jgi:NADH:ubiquinone oxidoreductase subunit H